MFQIFETIIPKPGMCARGTLDGSTHHPIPELLVLGTGNTPSPLPSAIRQYLSSQGISVEVMDTVRWNNL